jgi:hypothetical protein
MLTSTVLGQYCSVHQLLFISSLQEWLSFSPAHIAHAFGDAMQVVEATCPRCLAMTQTAMQRQFPALYTPSCIRNNCARSPSLQPANSSSNAFAFCRSTVSKPSVNQP